TPIQAVLDQHDPTESDVWLFSAGGNNPDAAAAAPAALDRKARRLHLVTPNPDWSAASIVDGGGGPVPGVPLAGPHDGYLAPPSLLSSVIDILLASDVVSRDPRSSARLLDALTSRLAEMRDHGIRASRISRLTTLGRTDTLIVTGDPLLKPMSVLLDTSI